MHASGNQVMSCVPWGGGSVLCLHREKNSWADFLKKCSPFLKRLKEIKRKRTKIEKKKNVGEVGSGSSRGVPSEGI